MTRDMPALGAVWHAIRETSLRVSAPGGKVIPVESDAYGAGMGRHLYLAQAPMIGVQDPRNIRLAVTRLASDCALPDRTIPFRRDPFFTVQLYLRPTSGARLWLGEKEQKVDPTRYVGSVTTHDFACEPSVYLGSAFDILQFYIPREALAAFSDENGLRRCEELSWPTGKVDPVFLPLALSILPAFQHPEDSPRIYLDYLILAAHSYIAQHFANIVVPTPVRGGLAPWQQRRALELLRENLDGHIALADIARECELSPSYFAHAFKNTLGRPPHQWLVQQRLLMAKDLLLRSRLPIVDIALCCGFSDQSALFRAFKKNTGMSPDQWRRNQKP